MKSLCTHKLHANLPNTRNQLMYKAIISATAQKNAWLVQFTIKVSLAVCNRKVEGRLSLAKLLLDNFNSEHVELAWIGFLFEPKIFARLLLLSDFGWLRKKLHKILICINVQSKYKRTNSKKLLVDIYLLKIHF